MGQQIQVTEKNQISMRYVCQNYRRGIRFSEKERRGDVLDHKFGPNSGPQNTSYGPWSRQFFPALWPMAFQSKKGISELEEHADWCSFSVVVKGRK